jgi:hypothetical protein
LMNYGMLLGGLDRLWKVASDTAGRVAGSPDSFNGRVSKSSKLSLVSMPIVGDPYPRNLLSHLFRLAAHLQRVIHLHGIQHQFPHQRVPPPSLRLAVVQRDQRFVQETTRCSHRYFRECLVHGRSGKAKSRAQLAGMEEERRILRDTMCDSRDTLCGVDGAVRMARL